MMMISKLKILSISDVHLGHRTTPTQQIIESMNNIIKDSAWFAEHDLMVIAGDLFDRLLYLSNVDITHIHAWMHFLLRLCKKHDIVLRVLEGTPSHDNKQSRLLIDINEESDIGCDVQFVEKLEIEYIDRFDINVLYIPDEWYPDCSMTLAEVKQVMSDKGLTQVDFAVMHGQFDYQVPTNLLSRIPHHDSREYLSLVKYIIFIGHVHHHSQLERILVAGSVDRLKHGEEEDKGLISVDVYENGEFDASFVVNKNAQTYKTIDITNLEIAEAFEVLTEQIKQLKEGSYLRIRTTSENANSNLLKELKTQYSHINWSIITERAVKFNKPEVSEVKPIMEGLRLDAIPGLIEKRLADKYDTSMVTRTVNILKEMISADNPPSVNSQSNG